MQNIVSLVCKNPDLAEQFEQLAVYFGRLKPDQLVNEDLEEFISMVSSEHKILMSVFVHSYLGPNLGQRQLFFPGSGVTRRFILEDGKLDARGCLTSRSMPFTSKLDISLLLPEVMKLNLEENSIHTIDLSGNSLFSNDLQYVVTLLKRLHPYMTNAAILSLEDNQIHGIGEYRDVVDSLIGEIAVMDKISFIDMRTNPFCTVDRKTTLWAWGRMIWLLKNLFGFKATTCLDTVGKV